MSRIWIPRTKIIEPKDEMLVRMGVCGRYKLTVRDRHERVRRETPWFDNLITDNGLDALASTDVVLATCAVGTGNTAPTTSDTQLANQIATTTTIQSTNEGTDSNSPYSFTKTIVKRFAQGAAAGNLAEVGIGSAANSLFSRALILDEGGSPTTLTVLADELLDVTYQVIGYPPLTDVEDTITVTGSGSHDIVYRACRAGNATFWKSGSANRLLLITAFLGIAYDGAIGAITGNPSGSSDNATSDEDGTYTNGTFFRDCTFTWGLGDGNFTGGIDAAEFRFGNNLQGLITFQCSYTPAIPKDDTTTLALVVRTSWGRSS